MARNISLAPMYICLSMVSVDKLGYGDAGRNGQIPSDWSDKMHLVRLSYVRGNAHFLLYYVLT